MPVPIGVRGELFIGGDGLACGYLNDSNLTAAKFIPNPFRPDALLYRTGDLARFLPDGNIEFLGRMDHQVKIRGFRVELGEIELVMKLHPAVRECVVVPQEHTGDKTLVAYVGFAAAIATVELRNFLKERLPAYMISSTFVCLETFPLTVNGKVDRKRLPLAEVRPSDTHETYVARTVTEETLVGIWGEVLNLTRVGVQDNFFDLGGTSLMVVRLISTVNRTLHVRLGIPDLLQNPTVEQLARIIDTGSPKLIPRVVQILEGSEQLPIYFTRAGSFEFRLAKAIGAGHSVCAIDVPWRLDWRTALPTMEEFVAPCAAALFAHVGSSPCVLVGYSFGGLMAFEMAHQHQKRGGKVDLIILLDSSAKFPSWYKQKRNNFKKDLKQALKELPGEQSSSIGLRLRYSWQAIECVFVVGYRKVRNLVKRSTRKREVDFFPLTEFQDEEGMPLHWQQIHRLYVNAMKHYDLRPVDCRGVLFRAQEDEATRGKDSLGWDGLFVRGLEIIPIELDHFQMMQDAPKVQALGQEINRLLHHINIGSSDGQWNAGPS